MLRQKEVKITTLIGKGAELKGDFTVEGSARIDGRVQGNVTISGSLVVGSGASILGDVSADSVLIGGEVLGNITAPKKAEITATAKVMGDVSTSVIVIDEHAVFQGKCDMNQAEPEKKRNGLEVKKTRTGKRSAKAALVEALKEVAEEEKKQEQTAAEEDSAAK